jgi:hypothetical protein
MRILAINVEIGMGHPNYLDYVLQAIKLIKPQTELTYWDVLTHEKWHNKLFWQVSKQIYLLGAKGGLITDFYTKFRTTSKTPRVPVCSVSSKGFDRILVSHPLLARNLSDVWYIHGEIASPKECVLGNIEKIVVPTEYTAKRLIAQGIRAEQILISGLLIAPDLIADAKGNQLKRLSRIKSEKPLTIGFFISGAYPPPHIKKVVAGIVSATKENHRIIVFLGIHQKKAKSFLRLLNKTKSKETGPEATILFIQGKTRMDYQKRVNRLLPLLDIFVAPSHEYTNWAVGLGLPMLALFPMIGSYAEENFKFAYEQGVVFPLRTIADARTLGKTVSGLRKRGTLLKLVDNGFSKFPIEGAKNTALKILATE